MFRFGFHQHHAFLSLFIGLFTLTSCNQNQSYSFSSDSLLLNSAKISFLNPPTTITAGSCTMLPLALSIDGQNTLNPEQSYFISVNANLLGLPPSGVSVPTQILFKDESCMIPFEDGLTLSPENPVGAVFVYSELALPVEIKASHLVWGTKTLSAIVNPHPTSQFIVMGTTTSAVAGQCAGPFQTVSQDAFGNTLIQNQNKTLTMASDPGLVLFSNSACTNLLPSSQITIAAGSASSNQFFARSNLTQLSSLWVQGFLSLAKAINVTPGVASLIRPIGPSSVQVGQCRPIQLNVVDAFGNLTPLSANQSVTHTHLGNLYTSSACSSLVPTNINFFAGDTVQTVFYRSDAILSADSIVINSSFGSASHALSVLTNPPTEIRISTANQDLISNNCKLIRLELFDLFGFPASSSLPLTASLYPSTLQYFSNANCSTSISALNIPPNTTAINYYVRTTQPQPAPLLNLNAQVSGLNYNTIALKPQFYFKVVEMLTVIDSADCNGTFFSSFPCSVHFNDSTGVKKLPASGNQVTFDDGVSINFDKCKNFSYNYAFTTTQVPINQGNSNTNGFNDFGNLVESPGDTLSSVVKLNEQMVTKNPPLTGNSCSGFFDILWTVQTNLRQF